MSSLAALAQYGSDSDSDSSSNNGDNISVNPKTGPSSAALLKSVSAAPAVAPRMGLEIARQIDPTTSELSYNPTASELFAPELGPANPKAKHGQSINKNTFTGYVEADYINPVMFEDQRTTYNALGYAVDPSTKSGTSVTKYIGDVKKANMQQGATVMSGGVKKDRRKRKAKGSADDIDNFLGPWARFEGDKDVAKPNEAEQAILTEQYRPKENKRGAARLDEQKEEATEKTTFHLKEMYDYLGRSYMHAPQDQGVNYGEVPERCYLPKKLIHTWTGHSKGVSTIKFIPKTAHLLLSAGMDSKIKLWEVYGDRRVVRTFLGHSEAVRDVAFNNAGSHFVSASYDRYCKLWDTETGDCLRRFTNKKIPYCVKFHPSEENQHLFVAGTADKKILCYDIRTGDVVQEYDRHLGAVNSISFVDDGKRMVTTSDDKSIRIWEWDIPVDIKYIAEPTMHSMPAMASHPSKKWMLAQSMDNQILTFSACDRFRQNKKKTYKGHLVAGYACQPDCSPNGAYVLSGDSKGFVYIWDFKTTKLYNKFKAHDDVCICVQWNPNETSKVATCGWDGLIKYWD